MAWIQVKLDERVSALYFRSKNLFTVKALRRNKQKFPRFKMVQQGNKEISRGTLLFEDPGDNLMSSFYCTWFRSFINGSIVDLVDELGPIVIHVDDIDVEVNWILHFVSIHIYCMGSKLFGGKKEHHVNNEILQRQPFHIIASVRLYAD